MKRASRPARADLICAALATVVPVVIAAVVLELWAIPDPRVSLSLRGDAPPLLAMIKDLNASGWYFTNPNLGAPFGQELYDFPVYAGDTLHFLVLKAMSWVGVTSDLRKPPLELLESKRLTGATPHAGLEQSPTAL